jgi:hypothetical protein
MDTQHITLSFFQFHNNHIQDTTPRYKEHKRGENAITYPQDIKYILHQSEKGPKEIHGYNIYAHTKLKKIFYKHLIFNVNDFTF